MPDTALTRSELVTALADNSMGAITAQTLRDLLASTFIVGDGDAASGVLQVNGTLSASEVQANDLVTNNVFSAANGNLTLNGGSTGSLTTNGGTILDDSQGNMTIQGANGLGFNGTSTLIVSSQNFNGDINVQGLTNGIMTTDGNVLSDQYGAMATLNGIYFGAPIYNCGGILPDGSGGLQFVDSAGNYMRWNAAAGDGLYVSGSVNIGSGSRLYELSSEVFNVSAGSGTYIQIDGSANNITTSGGNTLDNGSGSMTLAGTLTATPDTYGIALYGNGSSTTTASLGLQSGTSLWCVSSRPTIVGGNLVFYYSSTGVNGAFNSMLTISTAGAVAASSFSGSGASLTSLNASNISSGTLTNARLPSAISVTSVAATTLSGGFINTTTTQTPSSGGTYNVSASDSVVLVNASAGVCTVKLPAPVLGREYTIKKIDSAAHTITISTTSGTIDGSSTNTSLTTQWYYITVTSDGTNWFIIGAGTT